MKPLLSFACPMVLPIQGLLALAAVMIGMPLPRAADAADPPPGEPRLILHGVRVFDVDSGKMTDPLDVAIRGDRIEELGRLSTHKEDEVVDASGLYALPGLFDSHTHLAELAPQGEQAQDSTLARFVKAGILQVRDVGGPLEIMRAMRERIDSGQAIGPEIFYSGPMLERSPLTWEARNEQLPGFTVPIDTEGAVDSLLPLLAAGGARCVKAFGKFDPEVFAHLVTRARELKLPVVHDPGPPLFHEVAMDRSIEWGVSSVEHGKAPWPIILKEDLQKEHDAFLANKADRTQRMPFVMRVASLGVASIDDAKLDALARKMIDRHVSFCPTLQVFSAMAGDSTAVPPPMKPVVQAMEAISNHVVGRMSKAGVEILVGQDGIDPEGTRREMRLLAQAGVPPVEILRGATIHAARTLACDGDYGSIAPGRIANLVLLDADPLERIENAEEVSLVVVKGKVLERP